MKKIIFISGFTGGKRNIFLVKKILKDYDLIYFKYNTLLVQPIEELAKELAKFIKNLKTKKEEKINLIGLSAGGIIAVYYTKFLDNKKIDKIFTIYSPFKGTYFTYLLPKKLKGLQ